MDCELTQERLKELVVYDEFTGEMYWKTTGRGKKKSLTCGGIANSGYRATRIDGKLYLNHRLAFLYMTGKFPKDNVDHIDHNKLNNSWNNLRVVSQRYNIRNSKLSKDNTSGCVGVYFHKPTQKWQARIQTDTGPLSLGLFHSKEEATMVREAAGLILGYHKNHGST